MNSAKAPSSNEHHFYAGLAAGTASAISMYPIDLVKVRYQVYDKSGNAYRSLLGAFQTIVKEEGIRGLFMGVIPAILASAISWGGYLYFYERSKRRKLGTSSEIQPHAEAASNIPQLNTVDHLLSGVEAGVYMVFITNPLWLLKTRLQTQINPLETKVSSVADPNVNSHRYKGPADAIRVIYKEEGIIGFYRGAIPALFLTSHGAVQFAVYEQLKAGFKTFQKINEKHNQPAYVSMTIGVLSKMVASTLTYPYQVMKSRLQQRGVMEEITLSSGETVKRRVAKYNGLYDCANQIARKEGMKGFFRGLVPNCIKVAPGAAVTFVVYEECLKLLRH